MADLMKKLKASRLFPPELKKELESERSQVGFGREGSKKF